MTGRMNMVGAFLYELHGALMRLRESGDTYTAYLETTGLTDEEKVEVLETLGRGNVTIRYAETDQPVEWYETNFSGIWVGTYKNGRDDSIVYTVEVSRYPAVAAAFDEDIEESAEELRIWCEASRI